MCRVSEKTPQSDPSSADFEARLKKARVAAGKDAPKGADDRPQSPMGWAFRIGVELVAALIVGIGFGYLLDAWLGTAPLMMVLFFFLGAGAGFLNVYRVAMGLGMRPGYRPQGEEDGGDRR